MSVLPGPSKKWEGKQDLAPNRQDCPDQIATTTAAMAMGSVYLVPKFLMTKLPVLGRRHAAKKNFPLSSHGLFQNRW
jgi:hypothetical protein